LIYIREILFKVMAWGWRVFGGTNDSGFRPLIKASTYNVIDVGAITRNHNTNLNEYP
jgi:hypothetical protein